ncbi:MAG: hypothetical protein PHY72_02990, partial [Candidatus Pacebacteria bacterium]|nr:hypothetical protein [Candidatus Paceibacterota bacterium]
YQLCGNYDTDSCLEWSTAYSCPSGQACSGSGVCSNTCSNQCSNISDWSCPTTNTYKICAQNSNGCLDWSSVYTCDTGYTCNASQRMCAPQNNNQGTATLSANKTQAKINENVSFTLQADDQDGIEQICLITNTYATAKCKTCNNQTSCSNVWNETKSTAGLYSFSGYAITKTPQGATQTINTSPVSVLFKQPETICENQCLTISAWSCPTSNTYKVCGDFNNDGCLEWSNSYSCNTGYTCDATNKTCSVIGDNPTSGNLTATKTTAQINENVSFTVTGRDTDGISKVCLLDGTNQTPTCQNASTYTWTLTKQTPGEYFFYGYVDGKNPNGGQVERTTDPFFVKVVFQSKPVVCENQCSSLGQWACPSDGTYKVCQDTNNDGCLEWSSTNACQGGLYCSESQRACLQPTDHPTTISLTASQTTAKVNENISFSVNASDQDGVEKVCFIDNAFSTTPECIDCSGATCQKNFIKTKQNPGLYVFSAYTIAKRAEGGTNSVSANSVSVLFSSPQISCVDECSANGTTQCQGNSAVRFCGNYDSDSCLEWSPATPCLSGQTCSGTDNFCKYPENGQASGVIQVSQNSICGGSQYPQITITVTGNDSDGVQKVCYTEGVNGFLNCQDCDGGVNCQKTWTKLINTGIGTSYFYGKVFGNNPNGSSDSVNTVPQYQAVEIKNCCLNECSSPGISECFGGSVRTCQSQSNGCLAWSNTTNCGSDTYTDEYRCSNDSNILQRKIIRKGCSGYACYERTEWVDYDNCQARDEVCNSSTNTCNSKFLEVSCFAAPSTAKRGELSWVVARVAGGVGPYQFSWSGDYSGTEQTVSKTFFTKGTYNAYLTVKAGDQTKSASCQAQVSDEIAVYANHPGTANIWVSNTTVYTGETFTISIFGADEDGIDGIEAYYQNNWHSQSASGNSGTRNWQVTEYTPNRYLYCGKVNGRTLTGSRDISYSNPRCIEVWVRSR